MDKKIIIKELDKNEIDQAVDIVLSTFKDEAFTKAWLDLSNEKVKDSYRTACKIKYILTLEAGHPVFVALEDKQVIGFVVLKAPGVKASKMKAVGLILKNLYNLITLIPSFTRVMRLGVSSATKPPKSLVSPYYALEAIAVAPRHQGKKVGRILLNYAHDFCLSDKNSTGIYLFTGDEKNKDIYERFSYEIIETRNTNGFTSYHMFLANSQQ
jgi:GNAT superfamily N-acetyltransferase